MPGRAPRAPTLSPDALITQEDIDELNALLVAYEAADTDARDALADLNDFVEQRSNQFAGSIDEALDLFGDGRVKVREACTRAGGAVPARLDRRPGGPPPDRAAKRQKQPYNANAAERRHPDAAIPVGIMMQADSKAADNYTAWQARAAAAQALNVKAWTLCRPAGVKMTGGQMVDAFGDGTLKAIEECTIPAGVSVVRHTSTR